MEGSRVPVLGVGPPPSLTLRGGGRNGGASLPPCPMPAHPAATAAIPAAVATTTAVAAVWPARCAAYWEGWEPPQRSSPSHSGGDVCVCVAACVAACLLLPWAWGAGVMGPHAARAHAICPPSGMHPQAPRPPHPHTPHSTTGHCTSRTTPSTGPVRSLHPHAHTCAHTHTTHLQSSAGGWPSGAMCPRESQA